MPKLIVVAGGAELHGTGTAIISCVARDDNRNRHPAHLRGMIVSGLGRHVFSPTSELQNGVKLILETGNPRLVLGKLTMPLKQHPQDQGMCPLDAMLPAPLDKTTRESAEDDGLDAEETTFGKAADLSDDDMSGAVFATTVSADVRHRRVGLLNPRSSFVRGTETTSSALTRYRAAKSVPLARAGNSCNPRSARPQRLG